MKTTKKISGLIMLLALTLFITSTIPLVSHAEEIDFTAPSSLKAFEGQLKDYAVVKKSLENNFLLVTINNTDIALNITEETLAIDSKTGIAASISDLKAGDNIFVYYSAVMTKSLPPQSHAIAIITQTEPNKSHAELFTVREIISRKDGLVRALNKEGDLIVAFSKDISLTPYKTKQLVALEDIQVGTQLFIWYEIVALSYPGQTGATKAVIVGQAEGLGVRAVYTPISGATATKLFIQNKAMELSQKPLIDKNGLLMIPLRAVAEELGFKVTWNNNERSVFLDNSLVNTTLKIGEDAYYKASSQALGLTQSFQLGEAPVIIGNTTYVPASLFNLLYSDNNAVKVEAPAPF